MRINENYSRHMSDMMPIKNGLKQGGAHTIGFELSLRICH